MLSLAVLFSFLVAAAPAMSPSHGRSAVERVGERVGAQAETMTETMTEAMAETQTEMMTQTETMRAGDMPAVSSSSSSSSSPSSAIKTALGDTFDPSKKYVIAIQGVSTGGKTTFARKLEEVLAGAGRVVLNVSTDGFYLDKSDGNHNIDNNNDSINGTSRDASLKDYDFDSPAALDWPAMARCFSSYLSDGPHCVFSSYDYKTKARTETTGPNPRYNVIIVEGIFAHNLFNERVFSIGGVDGGDHHRSEVDDNYTLNHYIDRHSFKILKIFMDLDVDTMRRTRLRIDRIRANRGAQESLARFNTFVLPSVQRWVKPSGRESHIRLERGTRDIAECTEVFREIARYFGVEGGVGEEFRGYLEGLGGED